MQSSKGVALIGLCFAVQGCSERCRAGIYRLLELVPLEGSCDPTTMASLSDYATHLYGSTSTCDKECGESWFQGSVNGLTTMANFTFGNHGLDGEFEAYSSSARCSERFAMRFAFDGPCAPAADAFVEVDAVLSPDAAGLYCDGSICTGTLDALGP